MNNLKTMIQKLILINTDSLIPYAGNSRTHSDEQVRQIAASIKEFGFNNPVLIDEANGIIAGHGRVLAAAKLELKEVPTICLKHLSDAQRRAYVIADNKLAMNAGWDEEALAAEIARLSEEDFDIDLLGFNTDELDALLNDEPTEGLTDEDEVPEVPEQPVSIEGDIWLLGDHRLMCGDSTSIDAVEKLMNGNKADMVYTDPPYGINEACDRVEHVKTFKNQGVAKKGSYSQILGDDTIETAMKAIKVCESLNVDCEIYWGGNYYNLPPSPCWIVWDKRVEENQTDLNSDCELAYVKHKNKASVRIFRHLWKGMIKASEQGEARVHPTQKPISLAEWCFMKYGEPRSVIDLFGGSGSTLIACEKTNRKCYMMELDPKYCDVIVKRWQDFTGKQATHAETGKTFDESH